MSGNKEEAIKKAKELINQIGDVMHGISHMESVINYSREIAKSYPGVDLEVLEMAVWWHDVGRLHGDKDHPLRSAEKVNEMLPWFGFDNDFVQKVHDVVISHGNRMGIATTSLEGRILKDADKLDFLTIDRWKLGIRHKRSQEIEIGLERIPAIRNHVLSLPKSKKKFDQLFLELKNFWREVDDPFLGEYKGKLAALRILD